MYWWVTQSHKIEDKAWRELNGYLPRGIVKKRSESRGDLYVELGNGCRIAIKSADAPASLISESCDGIVGDEVFSWKSDVWQDYLRPTIGARPHARVLFLGSPRGRNWAYRSLYLAERDKKPGWASFQWRSDESPYFTHDEFVAAKIDLPEVFFRQNYLAEFLEQGGDVFRNVEGCTGPYAERDDYTVIGFDVARTRDWSVLWAMNSNHETVEVQRFQNLDWSIQRPRAVEMFHRLNARKLLIDATGMNVGADAVTQDLMEDNVVVEEVTISGPVKRAMVEGMMLKFDTAGILIPDPKYAGPLGQIIVDEFKDYEAVVTQAGNTRYSAPEGMHDDCVMACGLAEWGLRFMHSRARREPPRPPSLVELEMARMGWGPNGQNIEPEPTNGWVA